LRIQGSFSSDKDIQAIIKHASAQDVVRYNEEVTEVRSSSSMNKEGNQGMAGEDELYNEASETLAAAGKASASLLQRRLRIGYSRAARLIDMLEEKGIVGPADGAKPREVFADSAERGDATKAHLISGGGLDESEEEPEDGSWQKV